MPAPNTYDVGDLVRLSAVFRNSAGAATDPTAPTLTYKKPSGTLVTVVSPTLIKDSTGNYHYDVTLDESGSWWYRFSGTGAVTQAGEKEIVVRAQRVQ